eukprot:scaffold23434_cov135-Isochrysis_galbana.AAC.3
MLKAGSTWLAMPSRVRKVRMSRMMYGGVYMRQFLPISNKTVDSAPKREVPPGTASIRAASSAAMSSGEPAPKVSLTSRRYSIGEATKPVAMKACTSPS